METHYITRHVEAARTRPYQKNDNGYAEKKPRTPYEGLMESPDVSEECKAELLRRRAGYNPAAMNRRLNEPVGRILKLNREKKHGEKASSGGWPGPGGLILARFLFPANRPFSAGLIMRQCGELTT
jgi:hypothetical protein